MALNKVKTATTLFLLLLGIYIVYKIGGRLVSLSSEIISRKSMSPPKLDTQRIINLMNPAHKTAYQKKSGPSSSNEEKSGDSSAYQEKSADSSSDQKKSGVYTGYKEQLRPSQGYQEKSGAHLKKTVETINTNNNQNISKQDRNSLEKHKNFIRTTNSTEPNKGRELLKRKPSNLLNSFTTDQPKKLSMTQKTFDKPQVNLQGQTKYLNNKKIKVINLQVPSEDPAHCLISKTEPPYKVCIYDTEIDNTVSLHLKNNGLWEKAYIPTFQKILNSDPNLGFIDIGANIGPWGLLAATMGHKTVMVEPYPDHVSKIKKSVQIGKITENVVLIENALSDSYEEYTTHLAWGDTNLGAIRMVPYDGNGVRITSVLMDDIVEVMTFKRALLKIDAEGFEDKALSRSDKLFKDIFIPYVLMEWAFPKYVFRHDVKRVKTLINIMVEKGYLPYDYGWKPLQIAKWVDWPLDLIWGHKLVTPIC